MNRTAVLSRLPGVQGGPSLDPSEMAKSGLVMDVQFDYTAVQLEDNTATDGFIIHVGTMPTPLSTPVVVPAGAEALITLAPPTRITERSKCLTGNKLPRLQYYD